MVVFNFTRRDSLVRQKEQGNKDHSLIVQWVVLKTFLCYDEEGLVFEF